MKRLAASTLRWSLTGVVALAASLWLFSKFYIVIADDPAGSLARLYDGRIIYGSYESLRWPGPPRRVIVTRRQPADTCQQYGAIRNEASVSQPLWHYIAIAGTPAFFMWRQRLRGTPGSCRRCGYDLAGLASTICPECGRAFTATAPQTAPNA